MVAICTGSALPINGQHSFASKVLVSGSSQESELNLTPKEFANFSPRFPTLGQSASNELLTLKEFHPVT